MSGFSIIYNGSCFRYFITGLI